MAGAVLKWKRVASPSGLQPQPRHGHRAINIEELMVVFGGNNYGIFNKLHVYNTATNQWCEPATRGKRPSGRTKFGFVVEGTRIFVFGGMIENRTYTNELYELQTTRWEWRKLKALPPDNGVEPCPRIGHTFTMVNEKIYLFGGLVNASEDPRCNIPKYVNDLYILDVNSVPLKWNLPQTYGETPPPRESHTAVAYTCKKTNRTYLVIYGGVNGRPLGDLWMLDTESMIWTHPLTQGITPLPRGVHSSTMIGHRMFLFGGWVPLVLDKLKRTPGEKNFDVTNSLTCLNLVTMHWEEIIMDSPEDVPRGRFGHCAVGIHNRLYIWSGRHGDCHVWDHQECYRDLWYFEVEVPAAAARVGLVRSKHFSLKLRWAATPTAQTYMLEIQKKYTTAQAPPLAIIQPHSVTSSFTTGASLIVNTLKRLPSCIPVRLVTPQTGVATIEQKPTVPDIGKKWNCVGIFKTLEHTVTDYILYSEWNSTMADKNITSDTLPDLSKCLRVPLEPGTAYRFRLTAINGYGMGDFGKASSFKTLMPGFPGAPSLLKIFASQKGVYISWNRPPSTQGKTLEYSVYMALKSSQQRDRAPPALLEFERVYCGPNKQCIVMNAILASAHVDIKSRPAIIFDIFARNDNGYGASNRVRLFIDTSSAKRSASLALHLENQRVRPPKRPRDGFTHTQLGST